MNPGFESISGYPLEEIAGWTQEQFFSLFSGDYRDQLRDEWDPSDGSRFRLLKESLPIHCKNGTRRWVSLNLARLSLDGAPSILCSLVDITATHQAEEKERVNLAETIRCQKAIVEIATHEAMSKGREVSFRIITEITARTLNVARISIWFWDEAHENLVCHDLYITVADRHEPGMVISMKDFPAYFEAIESGRAIAAHNAHTHESTFEFSESYLKPLGINSMLDAPIRKGGNLIGVICLEHIGPFRQWQQREITFAGEVADQVSQALLNDERAEAVAAMQAAEAKVRKLNADLESKVEERTDALQAAQAELLEKAHQSGMADIATSVIHNIGNALNSLLVSSKLILDNASRRDYRSLEKANALLETLIDKNHPKADELIRYYQALYKVINEECRDLQDNAKRAYQQIHYIREVVEAQEDYANAESHALLLDLPEIIEDSLKLVGHSLMREEILIHKNFGEDLPPVHAVKCKVLHVLVQVFKNAVESLHMVEDRRLYLDLIRSEGNLVLKVKDTGTGFPVEDNKRIFAQGYTTKEGYSGFGLHSCANAMTEMGGSICGESEGLGQGAEFFLTFPLK